MIPTFRTIYPSSPVTVDSWFGFSSCELLLLLFVTTGVVPFVVDEFELLLDDFPIILEVVSLKVLSSRATINLIYFPASALTRL